ncbi:DUF2975 domain-containing protein [Sphingobacterium pedocola]|uniref:DUF2975 domain-containing protein n=1 Tax=Sphingobacterium pedocola TaxID=2082722 RepID=A0ABR9T7I0_9SPHI|nr:DUF2975 domain-containing protein [Sphingobacterium pedocola]MBE8720834.1 hypothetical protein [Sphingobacterium pedocola]
MKLSDIKVIKWLNRLATVVAVFYLIFLAVHVFTSNAPRASNSLKGYNMYNVSAEYKDSKSPNTLKKWFNDRVVVQPTSKALVHLRFKSMSELISGSAILYQLAQLTYWLIIGFLILCIKMLFSSFSKDKVFTKRNASLILWGSTALIALPMVRWMAQELFINCIKTMNLNDSGYALTNGASVIAAETLIGLALLAFGLTFKAGVDMKKENESFI